MGQLERRDAVVWWLVFLGVCFHIICGVVGTQGSEARMPLYHKKIWGESKRGMDKPATLRKTSYGSSGGYGDGHDPGYKDGGHGNESGPGGNGGGGFGGGFGGGPGGGGCNSCGGGGGFGGGNQPGMGRPGYDGPEPGKGYGPDYRRDMQPKMATHH